MTSLLIDCCIVTTKVHHHYYNHNHPIENQMRVSNRPQSPRACAQVSARLGRSTKPHGLQFINRPIRPQKTVSANAPSYPERLKIVIFATQLFFLMWHPFDGFKFAPAHHAILGVVAMPLCSPLSFS